MFDGDMVWYVRLWQVGALKNGERYAYGYYGEPLDRATLGPL